MAVNEAQRLDDLAEELTRRLGIPFRSSDAGTITFRSRLRVTEWAVPLMFDGHVAREDDALVPKDFVGHALWPTLRTVRNGDEERPWWYCTLSPAAAVAIVDALQEDDDRPLDDGDWVIGRDVLLDETYRTPAPAPARPDRSRRVA